MKTGAAGRSGPGGDANLSNDAIDTSIIAILAHGDRAGLGPKMSELVKTRRDDARIEIFYVTGTHYRAFMSPCSNVLRNAFYRIAD
ncbi:MAG TPA: hypothetical protein VFS57_05560 [Gemmatimonadaceae bacterium]|nr:hypothetical protein [Gemmatimonadaceae bacterium]